MSLSVAVKPVDEVTPVLTRLRGLLSQMPGSFIDGLGSSILS